MCEYCQGEGCFETDDQYDGAGNLVVAGTKVRCHCQEDDEL